MATNVYYNGVELHNVVTRHWDQEIVYDESGTDVLFQRYHLQFEGLLHLQGRTLASTPAWIAQQGGGGPRNHITAMYEAVRQRLAESNRDLQVYIDNAMVLEIRAAGKNMATSDLENGPKPKHVEITSIASDQVFRVMFEIEGAIGDCRNGNKQSVLSNRWSVGEVMDGDFYTTKTVRGRVRFSSSIRPNPLSMRSVVVPGLEKGFKRESLDYVVSANGLEAEYTVVDRQVHYAAPWPATKIEGTYSEGTDDGITFFSDCHIALQGPPSARKRELLTLAIRCIEARTGQLAGAVNDKVLVVSAVLTEHIGETNSVEAHIRLKRTFDENDLPTALANLRQNVIGKSLTLPGYNPNISTAPELYGYARDTGTRNPATLFLAQCYLQMPCDASHKPNAAGRAGAAPAAAGAAGAGAWSMSAGDTAGGGGGVFSAAAGGTAIIGFVADGNLPPGKGPNFSREHAAAAYIICRQRSKFTTKHCRTQMPIARKLSKKTAKDDTAVIFTLGAPQFVREIRVDFERLGDWPEIPEPIDTIGDGDLTYVLLKHWDMPYPPTLSPDGSTFIYRIEAFYLYGCNRPPQPNEATRIGLLPFTGGNQYDTAIRRSDLYAERLAP